MDELNTRNFPLYEILDEQNSGVNYIRLLEGPYKDMVFSFGKISFSEIEDNDSDIEMHFDYDIKDSSGVEYVTEEFEQYIGNMLKEILIYQISQNEAVYTGGVDE